MKLSILSASRLAELAGLLVGFGGVAAVWYQGPTMSVVLAVLGICVALSVLIVGFLVWSVQSSRGSKSGLSFETRVAEGRVNVMGEEGMGLSGESVALVQGGGK